MKGMARIKREHRRDEAKARQEMHDALTREEKIVKLNHRRGLSKKELLRLEGK